MLVAYSNTGSITGAEWLTSDVQLRNGYIAGWVDGMAMATAISGSMSHVSKCTSGRTYGSIKEDVEKYIKNNPKDSNLIMAEVIYISLSKVCK